MLISVLCSFTSCCTFNGNVLVSLSDSSYFNAIFQLMMRYPVASMKFTFIQYYTFTKMFGKMGMSV